MFLSSVYISTLGSQFFLAHAPMCCFIVCGHTSFAVSSCCSKSQQAITHVELLRSLLMF